MENKILIASSYRYDPTLREIEKLFDAIHGFDGVYRLFDDMVYTMSCSNIVPTERFLEASDSLKAEVARLGEVFSISILWISDGTGGMTIGFDLYLTTHDRNLEMRMRLRRELDVALAEEARLNDLLSMNRKVLLGLHNRLEYLSNNDVREK
jgi:hypothetical protein